MQPLTAVSVTEKIVVGLDTLTLIVGVKAPVLHKNEPVPDAVNVELKGPQDAVAPDIAVTGTFFI